ncbi:MAG: M48 family metallopeptidase [Prevotella sp.]|uniref:M48 family metallopeptidase n=1 Tax=Prevotella sp. TaxID=59823 RepID=UPI002A2B8D4E|nr:M48 family metallopeptidase [Prevotella sp.]MDD7317978.1 M48 family metallopeptidase [Prevotellaceae bacterium]MDY4020402.1 M48 family metallopeptidase [Prevotella sp.]
MKYVGMQTQIRRNNRLSVLLLLMFPLIILGTVYMFFFILGMLGGGYYDSYGNWVSEFDINEVNSEFLAIFPWVVLIVGVWFLIAYKFNTWIIRKSVGARSLERRENPKLYNIVENMCMSCGMDMPMINIVDDPRLNAFASGINKKTYTVTVTTGLLNRLNDAELAGVIGHELTHIRNNDTRLLITSIVFVGIVSTIVSIIFHMIWRVAAFGNNNRNKNGMSVLVIMLVGLICGAIAYFFTAVTRFAISRKREYMADAGGAELCGDPLALANALRTISAAPGLKDCGREEVAQLFIIHPKDMTSGIMSLFNSIFSTHPDTAKRIEILEQF